MDVNGIIILIQYLLELFEQVWIYREEMAMNTDKLWMNCKREVGYLRDLTRSLWDAGALQMRLMHRR